MLIQSANFVKSSPSVNYCPNPDLPEFAFIGRSNVGKSSLINMLTERKGLAKTSGTPGKTQLINHFLINERWYLVDLPGYGYARTSKKDRAGWVEMIKGYLKGRKNLECIFLLVDIRVSPQSSDLQMMEWIAERNLPLVIVFTKADKLNVNAIGKKIMEYKKILEVEWDVLPISIVTSSNTKRGKEEIHSLIESLIEK